MRSLRLRWHGRRGWDTGAVSTAKPLVCPMAGGLRERGRPGPSHVSDRGLAAAVGRLAGNVLSAKHVPGELDGDANSVAFDFPLVLYQGEVGHL